MPSLRSALTVDFASAALKKALLSGLRDGYLELREDGRLVFVADLSDDELNGYVEQAVAHQGGVEVQVPHHHSVAAS